MVLSYLRTIFHSRVSLRIGLLAVKHGKITVDKTAEKMMERVTVRCVEGDEFMTMSFPYGNKLNNMLRSKSETVERSLERIKASVKKSEKKNIKKKNYKKFKTDNVQNKTAAACDTAEKTSESSSSTAGTTQEHVEDKLLCILSAGPLVEGGEKTLLGIDPNTCNKDAWIEGSILQVQDRLYRVSRNLPTVLGLRLPNKLMTGCPVHPRIDIEFANYEQCEYVWYLGCKENVSQTSLRSRGANEAPISQNQSSNSNSNDVTMTPESMEQDSSIPVIETCHTNISLTSSDLSKSLVFKIKAIERVWRPVSNERMFTPTDEMIGGMLKLECTPRDAERRGDVKVVESSCEVTASPQGFPFERRHKFTHEKTQDGCFRAVCYNILADMYADSTFSRDVLYPYCPPEVLDIDYREQIILKELTGFNGDIVCLQEVGKKFFQHSLQPALLNCGLNGLLQCKHKQVSEGEAIFYRYDKFRLVEEHNIVLSEAVKNYSYLLDGISCSPAMLKRFTDQASIAQVAVLECMSDPSRKLCVANTHLYFHPRAGHLRLVQTAVILGHLEALKASYKESIHSKIKEALLNIDTTIVSLQQDKGDLTILLCGDMNSNPRSGAYQFMASGNLPQNSVDWYTSGKDEFCGGIPLKHTLNLTDACRDVEYTNFVAGFHGKLDHMFIQSDSLAVDRMVPMSTHEEVTEFIALPNKVFPSDHMPLVCDIRWL